MPVPCHACFLHVPKTGGSSIVTALTRAFGPDRCYQVPSERLDQVPLALLLRRYSVVAGHFTVAQLQPVLSSTFAFTFLREPVDRAVSLFHFYRAQGSEARLDPRVERARTSDFESFVEQLPERVSPWSNWQTYVFSGARDCEMPASRLLPQALLNLDRFDFVGVQEQLTRGLQVLSAAQGWPMVPLEQRINATLDRPAVFELPPRTLRRLQELNDCDSELFNYARTRWSTRCGLASGVSSSSSHIDHTMARHVETGTGEIVVTDVWLEREAGRVVVRAHSSIGASDVTVGIRVSDVLNVEIYGVNTRLLGQRLHVSAGETFEVVFKLDLQRLCGEYDLTVAIHAGEDHLERCYHWLQPALRFGGEAPPDRHFSGIVDLNATSSIRSCPT